MSDDNHIHSIILQLIEVSQGQAAENAFLGNESQREEHIRFLTPIDQVSEGGSAPYEPENTFLVGKVTPKESKLTFDDIMTPITSEELYRHYLELPKDEFIKRINKTLYDHISAKLKEVKGKNVSDDENIWMQPNAAFVNWFHEKGIDIDSTESLIICSNIPDESVEKEDSSDALWAIADDMRTRKDDGEFDTYREAYRWAEKNMTHKGNQIQSSQLEGAYHKAKSEGRVG